MAPVQSIPDKRNQFPLGLWSDTCGSYLLDGPKRSASTGIEIVKRFGNPDDAEISTSYSERLNLSVRMHVRRYTRLTNAHSKSAAHHTAMTSLFVAWYNFCRRNEAVKRQTPAMAAGLTDHVWSIRELLEAAK